MLVSLVDQVCPEGVQINLEYICAIANKPFPISVDSRTRNFVSRAIFRWENFIGKLQTLMYRGDAQGLQSGDERHESSFLLHTSTRTSVA